MEQGLDTQGETEVPKVAVKVFIVPRKLGKQQSLAMLGNSLTIG